jgi:hypothetical protein
MNSNTPSSEVPASNISIPSAASLRGGWWRTIIVGLLIFLAGGVSGFAIARAVVIHRLSSLFSESPEGVADRLKRELQLSDEQRNSIEQIVRSHVPDLRKLRSRLTAEVRGEFQILMDEMSAVMTPPQRAQWRPKAENRLDTLFPIPTNPTDSPNH